MNESAKAMNCASYSPIERLLESSTYEWEGAQVRVSRGDRNGLPNSLTTVHPWRQLGCGRSAHGPGADGVHRISGETHPGRCGYQSKPPIHSPTRRPGSLATPPRGLKLHQTIVYFAQRIRDLRDYRQKVLMR